MLASSGIAAVVNRLIVPLLVMLLRDDSAAEPFRFTVPLLVILVSPLLSVVLLKFTVPPVTANALIALAVAVLFSVVTAVPLFARVPATTGFVMEFIDVPEKLMVPVPVIGMALVRLLVPALKSIVAPVTVLNVPVCALPDPVRLNVPTEPFTVPVLVNPILIVPAVP